MGTFEDLAKATGNKYVSKVSDGVDADVVNWIDTGSYALNAILSGSIYGGLPSNKVTAFAGPASTGKSFYALNIVKNFLDKNPKGAVFYFDTEQAITSELLETRGIDTNRIFIVPVVTIEEFRTQAVRIIEGYLEIPEGKREPMFMVLDSLGMLSTNKEVSDISAGKDTRDMTRTQLIKGAFRVLTLRLGKAGVALLLTNHTYETQEMYSQTIMSGGTGPQYAASTIIFLSKSKQKDASTNEVTGAIIKAKVNKSRFTVENKSIPTLLDYQKGLNKYYGLLEIAEKYGLVKKIANKYQFGDVTAFEKAIYKNPEKYFTKELLDKIDEAVGLEFKYGSSQVEIEEEVEEDV